MDAHPLGVLGSNFQLRHLERFFSRGDRKVNEAPHLLDFFFLDEVQRVKRLDLGRDLAGKGGSVEPSDAVDATLARQYRGPHVCRGVTQRADQSQACDYDPPRQVTCLPLRACRCSRWHR